MGADSKIAWTHSTFNPWVGCSNVGPGCDHCYAEAMNKRWGNDNWGHDVPRRRTNAKYWAQPIRWNIAAQKSGERRRVFCASMADVFDNEVPLEWRVDLFDLIRATPYLDWLLLTKRIGNVLKMLPPDWGYGWSNVWLGITVVNQEEVDRDIPKLAAIPAWIKWLSMEPLLERVTLAPRSEVPLGYFGKIDWVVVGGESGHHAREYRLSWAESLIEEGRDHDVPVFHKQLGASAWDDISYAGAHPQFKTRDRAGADPKEWPKMLQVRQFPAFRPVIDPPAVVA